MRQKSYVLCGLFVTGTGQAVEIELEIVRYSQAARWKDDVLIFQNLQKNKNFVEGSPI